MAQLIADMTKDCPREDCSITGGVGMVTCMYFAPTFDKHGNRTDAGDGNTTTSSYRCSTCGASWTTKTQYGETTITKHGDGK